LIVTIPGGNHELDLERGRLNAPHLLRDVEGDFQMEVRVSGAFRPADQAGVCRAGIFLYAGQRFLRVEKIVKSWEETTESCVSFSQEPEPGGNTWTWGVSRDQPVSLRLARRGDAWEVAFRQDGSSAPVWRVIKRGVAAKVKIGVFAEARSSGIFQLIFDRFTLAPLGGESP
jgi:regulation of enolase protein 1 (concanavalin A-like superfamily)